MTGKHGGRRYRYAFTTAIRRHLRAHETFRDHRKKLINEGFDLHTHLGVPGDHPDRYLGMYGAGFGVW